ncbi:Dabb family protein [Mycolicibacterium sp. lyk4-40-TYG-92]|uniref:Dabb family protein n=1 Tax=Mycolicibacterium sp. lyk4-40-TYG-92 TaxID=3040295 RepID=UPI002549DB34|nr:Dabb family protein [Mycolicibacterium sp. lyk4-40-TYG-92]
MPVAHVVTFTFKSNTPPESIAELSAALDELASETAALSYRHGADLNIRPGNADYSVTAVFEDEAAFNTYISSERHVQILHGLIEPLGENRSAVQFATTPYSFGHRIAYGPARPRALLD